MTSRRSLLRCLTLVTACGAISTLPSAVAAQVVDRTGTLTIVWVDPRTGRPPPPRFHFTSDRGERWELEGVTPGMVQVPTGRVGMRVRVAGTPTAPAPRPGRTATEPKLRVQSIQPAGGFLLQAPAIRLGVDRYVTLRCVLPGLPADAMPPLATLQRWLAPAFPGVPHVMTEMSRDQYTIDGSVIAGPYLLPGTLETYVPDGSTSSNLGLITEECLNLADPEVDFSQVAGVNIQFNYGEPFAYGGGMYLTRDGPARLVGATWMPSWSGASIYTHEIGHSIGWPHSGGNYGTPYDSCWDVMSSPYCRYDPGEATWIPTHTIAAHRLGSAWIPPERAVIVRLGEERRLRVAASGAPIAAGAVEIVDVERAMAPRLIIESRRREGAYEGNIPGSGVVLHQRIQEYTDFGGITAQVLDVDGNGYPNDEAALWELGEVLEDSVGGARVEVVAAYPDGSHEVLAAAGWRLVVEASGPGTLQVDGTACTAPCTRVSTAFATQVQVSAVPAAGKALARWEGDCSGSGGCVVVMRGSRRVRAVFGTPVSISSVTPRPYAVAGSQFRDVLAATGGDGAVTWRVQGGALPQGLVLSPDGVVSGTAVRAGRSVVEVEAVSTLTSARATLTYDVFDPVQASSPTARVAATVGRPLELRLAGSGGGGPLAWSVSNGELPQGVALDGASGVLGGTPLQAGTSEVVIEARWDTLRASVPLTVAIFDRLAITSDSARPSARMGATVLDTLRAVPEELVRWRLVSGTLPDGVTLGENGVLTGVALAAGSFTFTLRATVENDSVTRAFGLTVTKPTLSTAGVANQVLGGPVLTEDERRFLDLLGNRNGRVDLADARAWLIDTGQLPGASSMADAMTALGRPGKGSGP